MAKKSGKQTTKATTKKGKSPIPGTRVDASEHDKHKGAARAAEEKGRWADAAKAWERAADTAPNQKAAKEAAGRAAAAKVRASAKSAPLDEQLEDSDKASKNAASWDEAMPEPGYVPPAGTGDETARNDAGDDSAAEGATGAEAGEQAPPADYVDPEFAKALAARKARKPTSDPRLPPVGTVIIKKDRAGNERCRCTIVDGGVEYAGTTYKSISAAAMAAAKDLGLASKTADGYAFFQLKKAAARAGGSKRDPVESLQKAWERYHERAAAAAKVEGDEQRAKIHAAIAEHVAALQALTAGASA